MRVVLTCVITQEVAVISDRRFVTTCQSHLQGLVPEDGGRYGFPETSGRNYHYLPRNNQEELRSNIDNLPAIFIKHKIHPNRIFDMEGTCNTTLPSKLPKVAAEQFKRRDSAARLCPQIVVNCSLFCSTWQVLQAFNSSVMILRCVMNCVRQLQWETLPFISDKEYTKIHFFMQWFNILNKTMSRLHKVRRFCLFQTHVCHCITGVIISYRDNHRASLSARLQAHCV